MDLSSIIILICLYTMSLGLTVALIKQSFTDTQTRTIIKLLVIGFMFILGPLLIMYKVGEFLIDYE